MTTKNDVLNFKDKDGKEINVRVKLPNSEDHQQAQIVSAKAMRRAFEEGVIVKAKLDSYLREQGLWNDSMEAKANKMAEDIRKSEVMLAGGVATDKSRLDKTAGKALALKIKTMRSELDEHLAIQRQYDDVTAENIAQNAKFDYLVSACIFDDDSGERLFSSVEDYKNKSTEPYAIASAWKLGMMLYPIDRDFDKKLVENQFLIKYGFVDENLRPINKDKKLVDNDGRLVDDMGNYVTEKGELCDKFGNLLDKDGFIQLTAEYTD